MANLTTICLQHVGTYAQMFRTSDIAELPAELLEQLQYTFDVEQLERFQETYTTRGISTDASWWNHLRSRSVKFKKRFHTEWPLGFQWWNKSVWLYQTDCRVDPRKIYYQERFADLLYRHLISSRHDTSSKGKPANSGQGLIESQLLKEFKFYGQFVEQIALRDNMCMDVSRNELLMQILLKQLKSLRLISMRPNHQVAVRGLVNRLLHHGCLQTLTIYESEIDEKDTMELLKICSGIKILPLPPDNESGPSTSTKTPTENICEDEEKPRYPLRKRRKHKEESEPTSDAVGESDLYDTAILSGTMVQSLRSLIIKSPRMDFFGSCLIDILPRWKGLQKLAYASPSSERGLNEDLKHLLADKLSSGQLTDLVVEDAAMVYNRSNPTAPPRPCTFIDLLLNIYEAPRKQPINSLNLKNSIFTSQETDLPKKVFNAPLVGVVYLDLSQNHMTEQSLATITSLIRQDTALRHLRMESVRSTSQPFWIQDILLAVQGNGQIESLGLRDNLTWGPSGDELVNTLQRVHTLTALDLTDCRLNTKLVASKEFQRAIVFHPNLRILKIASNGLGEVGIELLRSFFTLERYPAPTSAPSSSSSRSHAQTMPKLKQLDLSFNRMESSQVLAIGKEIVNILSEWRTLEPVLHSLDVSGNIQFVHLEEVHDVFKKITKELHCDVLDYVIANADHVAQM